MLIPTRLSVLILSLIPALALSAQEISPGPPAAPVRLDVVVAPKSGSAVAGLQQEDFKLMDNASPAEITSFRAVSARQEGQESVKVILLIDAVNTNFSRVAYVRQQVQKFLHTDGGSLAYPTSIAVLTDKGTELQKSFSTDGNALSAALDHTTIGLREITRASGIWGANERVDISLKAVQQLASYAATIPGRKIVLWVSPGWPLLSGVRIDLDSRQQAQIFGNVVAFSKELQTADITLYNINPLGPEENLFRANFYQEFVRGVSKPSQTDLADLSLQVLAVQSGGLSLNGSSDIVAGMKKCLADTDSWYEITFKPRAAEQPNEYHHIQVTVDKPGLATRTRDGYYAQP